MKKKNSVTWPLFLCIRTRVFSINMTFNEFLYAHSKMTPKCSQKYLYYIDQIFILLVKFELTNILLWDMSLIFIVYLFIYYLFSMCVLALYFSPFQCCGSSLNPCTMQPPFPLLSVAHHGFSLISSSLCGVSVSVISLFSTHTRGTLFNQRILNKKVARERERPFRAGFGIRKKKV